MSYASPDSFAQPPSYASPASFAAPPSYTPPGAPTTAPTITVPSDPNPITSVPDFDESPRTHRQAIVSDDD
jgi:hypothetical protein